MATKKTATSKNVAILNEMKAMKPTVTTVAVAGSWLMTQLREEWLATKLVQAGYSVDSQSTKIITTTAKGVAERARQLAETLGIPVQQFEADFRGQGPEAQGNRAKAMAEAANGLLVVTDQRGRNGETVALLHAFREAGKPVSVIDLSPAAPKDDAEARKARVLAAIAAQQTVQA